MSRVRESIDVAVPVHVAYERLCHFEEYPHFMAGVQEVTQISEDISHWVVDLDGTQAEFDTRVTGRRTDEMLSWHSIDGPQLGETVTFEALGDDRTRIIAELELEAQALMPTEAHGQESLDRRLKADLDGFKHYIEESTEGMLPGMSGLFGHNVMPANPALDDGGILGTANPPAMATPARRPGSAPPSHAPTRQPGIRQNITGQPGTGQRGSGQPGIRQAGSGQPGGRQGRNGSGGRSGRREHN
jgi:ribosome-associated toxin RatA of RatAB toxin-antitoxin module